MPEGFWEFLHSARLHTWVNGLGKVEGSQPGEEVYEYSEGDWRYRDSFYGGASFHGGEMVWYKDQYVWGMNYHGHVIYPEESEEIYAVLRNALKAAVVGDLRGPESYFRGKLRYLSSQTNKPENSHFEHVEKIYDGPVLKYRCSFHGGPILK